jgi:hypothetical protein
MSNHTPGPWEIKRHFDPGYKNISAQKHTALAQVVWCMEDEDRSPSCEANAHLIAAAPELLEALERVKATGVFLGAIPQQMVDAAIAKAKGE